LSTRLKEKEEKIQEIIAKLTEEAAKGTPILVEGKKDAEALIELGIEGKIVTLKTGGKSFLDAATELEQTGASKTILFLDHDRRGKEGTKRLKKDLERRRIVPNIKFWQQLFSYVGREIQCIESLPSYLQTLHDKASAKES
jgi:5S rRNA maturation endonuclease (ribonuclease M5)